MAPKDRIEMTLPAMKLPEADYGQSIYADGGAWLMNPEVTTEIQLGGYGCRIRFSFTLW